MKNKLRNDKTCLNCGAEVPVRFCTFCGQENREPEETFGELVRHFFSDITHYDSKFLITVRDLVLRPGFLTREYIAGRRMRYLNPIRMYIFISFVFFLVLFGLNQRQALHPHMDLSAADSSAIRAAFKAQPQHLSAKGNLAPVTGDEDDEWLKINPFSNWYQSREQYDSLQHALPQAKRDGFLVRAFTHRLLFLKETYGERMGEVIAEKFKHTVPKIMFILLPFFALLLLLLYRRQKRTYVDHAIFSVHIHSFAFLLFLVCLLLDVIFHTPFFGNLSGWLLFLYLVLALRKMYHQTLLRSFLRACLLCLLYGIVIGVCFAGAGLVSFMMA